MPYAVGTPVANFSNDADIGIWDSTNFTAVAGDALIAIITWNYVSTTVTLSDIVGTNDSWTQIESGIFTADVGVKAFYLANAAAGSCTVRATYGVNVGYPTTVIIPVTGLTATPFDDAVFTYQASPGTGANAVTPGNTNTLAQQPAMVLGFAVNLNTNDQPSVGTGFTDLGSGGNSLRSWIEHKRVTATTATTSTFTATNATSDHHSCVIVMTEAAVVAGQPFGKRRGGIPFATPNRGVW